jgi:hypothetical protein
MATQRVENRRDSQPQEEARISSWCSPNPWLCHRLAFVLLFLLVAVIQPAPLWANGIPVQVYLDHLPFKATWSPASGSSGIAVVSANDELVRVMAQNLPAPPSAQIYYAWLEKITGDYLPVGALIYRSDGTASIDQHLEALPYSENFSWVLISLENPRQIGNTPSSAIALAGRLPNPLALPPSGNELPALLPVTGSNVAQEGFSLVQSYGPLILALALILTIYTLHRWRLDHLHRTSERLVVHHHQRRRSS